MQETHFAIGPTHGLNFRVDWNRSSFAKGEEWDGLAVGVVQAWIKSELIWGTEASDHAIGVTWYWDQLLSAMAKSWPYLLYEERYPAGLNPVVPNLLRSDARTRWAGLPAEQVADEDELVFAFEETHDLARGVHGIILPPLLLMREGNFFLAASDKGGVEYLAFDETVETLVELGDTIAKKISASDLPAHAAILRAWKNRDQMGVDQKISISTGLSEFTIKRVAKNADLGSFWMPYGHSTTLLAAARMVGDRLPPDQLSGVISTIRAFLRDEAKISRRLRDLSARAETVLMPLSAAAPYEQGYALAHYLRVEFQLGDGKADPAAILQNLDVDCTDIELSPELDAISIWDEATMPRILLNRSGVRAWYPTGKRSTLAHELCHILIDRTGSLPIGEILGGAIPRIPEQRANAFAAEFLLPRKTTAGMQISIEEVDEIIGSLSNEYEVSHELAAWQILRGNPGLRIEVKQILQERSYRFRSIFE